MKNSNFEVTMFSIKFETNRTSACLRFSYFIFINQGQDIKTYGNEKTTVRFHVGDDPQSVMVMKRTGDQGYIWRDAAIILDYGHSTDQGTQRVIKVSLL